jgi:formylglycine-generating enzyme required for sulfatase activity
VENPESSNPGQWLLDSGFASALLAPRKHGNVWEWCEDNWHPNYKGAPEDGSVWKGGDASSRVLRGGSWNNDPLYLPSAIRIRLHPDGRYNNVGFRVTRML